MPIFEIMKPALLLFLFSALFLPALAQDSWTVKWDGNAILQASGEDEKKNTVRLTPSSLDQRTSLILEYSQGEKRAGWERTIMLVDDRDKVLVKKKGSVFSISNTGLKSLFKESRVLHLYTVSLPTDPDLKVRVRVRRVHLCTLVLQ